MGYVLGATSALGLQSSSASCSPTGTANGYAVLHAGTSAARSASFAFNNGLRNGTLSIIAQSAMLTPVST